MKKGRFGVKNTPTGAEIVVNPSALCEKVVRRATSVAENLVRLQKETRKRIKEECGMPVFLAVERLCGITRASIIIISFVVVLFFCGGH